MFSVSDGLTDKDNLKNRIFLNTHFLQLHNFEVDGAFSLSTLSGFWLISQQISATDANFNLSRKSVTVRLSSLLSINTESKRNFSGLLTLVIYGYMLRELARTNF